MVWPALGARSVGRLTFWSWSMARSAVGPWPLARRARSVSQPVGPRSVSWSTPALGSRSLADPALRPGLELSRMWHLQMPRRVETDALQQVGVILPT